ncbi:MAG: ABC transporter ATP-binding protein, partial [Candidatus Poribacteria bacterium]|nr:ABC transporter ATP-binding protein [Candidatus Poribacteria bacterium]
MSKRDEFITIIRTLTTSSLTITDKQRTRLLQQAVQDYGLSVEEATEILENLGLVVEEGVNYFDVLGLSIEEIQGLDEEAIVDLIETAHKQHYSTSLRAGARIRPDGKTEEQWRNILNQARDTLKHAQKRREYITTYFSQKDLHSLPPSENMFPKAEPELSTTPVPIENQEKTFSPTTSVGVQLNQITKAFDTTVAVNDISLTIAPGELFFLLGPSGCGKSTLLRVLAGFYRPDVGELLFDGEVMNNVPPHQRNTGMVFQNYALWPHMTVGENIEYGLRLRKLEKSTRNEKITTVLEMVEMAEYRDRPVNTLSGGQQQRIALARALVIEPSVLLLDEPLSNLDAALRQNLRDEIKDIHSRTQITTLYVT